MKRVVSRCFAAANNKLQKKPKAPSAEPIADIPGSGKVKSECLYGINAVTAALCAGKRTLFRLYQQTNTSEPQGPRMQTIEKLVKERKIKIRPMQKTQLNKLTDGKAHQNVVLRCSKLAPSKVKKYNEFKKELPKAKGNVYLLLDKINDPHNFGALIRTGFYMGVDGIIISTEGSCPVTPTVAKVSAGATELLPMFQVKYIGDFLDAAKSDGWEVVATDSGGENCKFLGIDSFSLEKEGNVLVAVGSEGEGLTKDIEARANVKLCIPPKGDKALVGTYPYNIVDSLNVAVAAGVILSSIMNKVK